MVIENIEIDKTNEEFFLASELVKYGHPLIYLTGKAGTGKTTFLKYLKKTTKKNTVIVSYTGVAAVNAGGLTINSFFKIPLGPFIPNDIRLRTKSEKTDIDHSTIYNHFLYNKAQIDLLNGLELLIIDEVSMLRCDLLDVIDRLLKVFRKKENIAFGGVQVLLIGDTFQLPPIDKEWHILQPYYKSTFFFSSNVILNNKPFYIELKKIYRQKEQEFIDLLNKIRVNQISDVELSKLNQKYNPIFSTNDSNNHIILSTTNAQVTRTNTTKLDELNTELKVFAGEIVGTFPKDINGNYVLPTEQNLHLKVGAQVMILKNDTGEFKQYFNGKIGKISSLEDGSIIVEFPNELKVQIEKSSWNNVQYAWNKEKKKIEEEIIGTFTQYPLRLAWAITVHKSQGLTFENVYADLGSAFADGQVYVALSRCTSYSGIILKSQIPRSRIKTNARVIEFAKTETPNTLIVQELNSGKADYYYKKVREKIKKKDFEEAYNDFVKALTFRNDIETDLFKRYFIVLANKLSLFSVKQEKSLSRLNEIESIRLENEELNLSISKLENEKITQQEKINSQNDAVKLLLNKTKDCEEQNIKLRSEKKDSEKTIQNLEQTSREIQSNISELETTIIEQKKEISRLKSIKWYHKLFGKV